MKSPTLTEEQIERTSVEWAFCLTGGELNDKPLIYSYDSGGETKEGRFLYHYDGVPEYAEEDFDDLYKNYCEYFTAVCNFGVYGTQPPATITVDGKSYDLYETFSNSGETGCCCIDVEPDPFDGQECPYCERQPGEKHGCIYIGDGWIEAVYRRDAA